MKCDLLSKVNKGEYGRNIMYPCIERMCPLPQQIPIAETSKASTGCPVQDKINRMGAGGV
jgi:hypothetical protein